MEHIKKGCIVVRKSYKKDILFKIVKVTKTKHGKMLFYMGLQKELKQTVLWMI